MKFNDIKQGTILSTTMYLEVLTKGLNFLTVRDTFGQTFKVQGIDLIEKSMYANDQFDKEEKVSKTKAAEILVGAGDAVFECTYVKADGQERTLVGHLLQTENLLGRSDVRDLQITSGNPLRQIDHRTIKSIIHKNTKSTVK